MKYALYVFFLLVISISLFSYFGLEELEKRLSEEERRVMRLKIELGRKKENLDRLRAFIDKYRLRAYSEESALRELLTVIDRLKGSYEVEITGDIRKESGSWVADMVLSFKPVSGEDIARRLRELTGMTSPVALLEGVMVSTDERVVQIKLTLIQPFRERSP